jgi:hypothetical protein
MWPSVRVALIYATLFEAYKQSDPFAKRERLGLKGYGSYIFQTITKNPFTASKSNGSTIVMFASGIANVLRGDKYVNRLHDLLASQHLSEALLIEDSCRKRYSRPRAYSNLRYHDLIPILSVLESKFTFSNSGDEATIREFVSFLKSRLSWSLSQHAWTEIDRTLRSRSKRLSAFHRYYDWLFERLRPELVFVEDGSYGPRGYIFKWAKKRGITTAELQHGLVSHNHPAYNYGPAILSSTEYREYLPDHLLIYGPYWARKINTPSKKEIIGNPNLSQYLAEVTRPPSKARKKKVVMLISGGLNPEGIRRIAKDLRTILDSEKYEICVRPHPGEVPVAEKRYGELERNGTRIDLSSELERNGTRIDLSSDMYGSLVEADLVAGDVSTALFEAVSFGKRVFILDDPYTLLHVDRNTFPMFKSASELASLIADGNGLQMPSPALYWAEDWQQNYANFIAAALHRKGKGVNESGLGHSTSPENQKSVAGA